MFECHITCNISDAAKVENAGKLTEWKFSKIDGDPVLGKKVFCYLTLHHKDLIAIRAMLSTMTETLRVFGVEVVRQKIELIVFDTENYSHSA